jgi:hypothetical protein
MPYRCHDSVRQYLHHACHCGGANDQRFREAFIGIEVHCELARSQHSAYSFTCVLLLLPSTGDIGLIRPFHVFLTSEVLQDTLSERRSCLNHAP